MAKIEPAAELDEIHQGRAADRVAGPAEDTESNAQAARVLAAVAANILTPNEARELLGLEPTPPPAYKSDLVAGQDTGHKLSRSPKSHRSNCMSYTLRAAAYSSLNR